MLVKKAFFLIIFCVGIFGGCFFAFSQDSNKQAVDDEYELSLKEGGSYGQIVQFLRKQDAKVEKVKLEYKDMAVLVLVDLVVSFLCLFTALLLPGKKQTNIKAFLWFLFALNLWSMVLFFILKGLWFILFNFFVKLSPDKAVSVKDALSVFYTAMACGLYVWFIARTFAANFLVSLRTFFVVHLLHFAIVFLVVLALGSQNRWAWLVDENLSWQATFRNLVTDVDIAASDGSIWSAMRFRNYHL